MAEKMLKLKQVAERLNISLSAAYEMRHEGLPVHRLGKKNYRVSEEDLAEFLRRRREEAAAGAAPKPAKARLTLAHLNLD